MSGSQMSNMAHNWEREFFLAFDMKQHRLEFKGQKNSKAVRVSFSVDDLQEPLVIIA